MISEREVDYYCKCQRELCAHEPFLTPATKVGREPSLQASWLLYGYNFRPQPASPAMAIASALDPDLAACNLRELPCPQHAL